MTPEQEIYYLKILVAYLLKGIYYTEAEYMLVEEAIKKLNLKIKK